MNFKQPAKTVFVSICYMFVFCLSGGFLINDPALAGDKTVGPSGCDYTTIQPAISAAYSEGGGTVYVGPGTYNENIGLMSGVNVISQGNDDTVTYTDPWTGHETTVLQRAVSTIINGTGADSVVRIPETDVNVTLDGFTVQNVDPGVDTVFLIRIGGASPTIQNNIIRDNEGGEHSGGIGLIGFGASSSALVLNNFIHHLNGPGIGNGPNSQTIIRNNEIWDCNGTDAPGIGLMGNASPTIENNTIFGNHSAGIGSFLNGIEANNATLDIPPITGNIIKDNLKAGIGLARTAGDTGVINVIIGQSGAENSNEICDNSFAGIRLDGITSATVENNEIHHNGMAIGAPVDDDEGGSVGAGIRTMSDRGIDVGHLIVRNNRIHQNAKSGIRNSSGNVLIVTGNDIYQNTGAGIRTEKMGSTVTLENNTIRESTEAGVKIITAVSVGATGNSIYDNGKAGISSAGDQFDAAANTIYNNGFAGIEITWSYSGGTITGNNIHSNSLAGIVIKGPSTLNITKNDIHDNIRAGIHTGTSVADGGGFAGDPGDAYLTIKQNKVYRNGQTGYGAGIDVRHADGVISNNLIYKNYLAGIRFADYTDEIINNTVVANGQNGKGAGIVYDDLAGEVTASPAGCASVDIPIKNNICAFNEQAGIYVRTCPDYTCPLNRDYNLLCGNFGQGDNPDCTGSPWESGPCERKQLGTCSANANEIFGDPLFLDETGDNYNLGTGSPAGGTGEAGTDMGAYGGADPIDW